ncbi:MAG: Gfo/Idh/MocA family oxidoreductase [Verrucomicrobia bacterium]|jgi:predicted dehydrogenase|nr:Gfo/Idh/MocA family oxidoreductase [Verrucomicrobiota bacterium]
MSEIRIAIVGCGGIALQNHLPGIEMCQDARLVALCDNNAATLERAQADTGIKIASTQFEDIVTRDDVDAVIIATPNLFHAPIAHAAIKAAKHVLCEKPVAMSYQEAKDMAVAADAANVRHMTAFTYRFVPAMRYLNHLVQGGFLGQPYHFRCCRLQDWGDRDLGWRQESKLAGTGELGDMLSHRIDFSHLLYGKMSRLCAGLKRFIDDRKGHASDLDDWSTIMADFKNGATGVLESSKLATGRNESWKSQDYLELNGSEGSVVFYTGKWNELQIGKPGGDGLETQMIPSEFWAWPGSPRDPNVGDPLVTFRYDQAFEFLDAIQNQRACVPSFWDGAEALRIMDAAVLSSKESRWVNLD